MRPLSRFAELQRAVRARYVLRSCDSVGADARVTGTLRIVNEGRITIGKRFRLAGEPVASHLWAQDGGTIEIGDDVRIAHGSGITARSLISIGSGTRLGAFVLAMDTDYHVAGDPNASAEIVPLYVGRGVFIGNRVTLLRGSVIGDGARVLDGSVVRGVVPEGQVVEGVPARAIHAGDLLGSNNSPEGRVLRLAQTTFRLRELPNLSDGPDQIEGWDSLGVLSFILAMEDEFGVSIGEDRIPGISCLGDAAAMVASSSPSENLRLEHRG